MTDPKKAAWVLVVLAKATMGWVVISAIVFKSFTITSIGLIVSMTIAAVVVIKCMPRNRYTYGLVGAICIVVVCAALLMTPI